MREFFAAKMVYEWHLGGEVGDPDDAGVATCVPCAEGAFAGKSGSAQHRMSLVRLSNESVSNTSRQRPTNLCNVISPAAPFCSAEACASWVVGVAFDDLQKAAQAGTPAQELARLKKCGGGLSLCYRLMDSRLVVLCKILFVVQKGCWSWYAYQIKNYKSPADNLRYLSWVSGNWYKEDHLVSTLRHSLSSASDLDWIGIGVKDVSEQNKLILRQLVELTWNVLAHQ